MLNAMAKTDAAKEAPGLAAIEAILDLQKKSGYRRPQTTTGAHAKFEALQRNQEAGSEGFNRLYPRHKLASAPVGPERDDARDERIGPDLAAGIRVFDASRWAMCGRLLAVKGLSHGCSIGRGSHVFGLLLRLT